MSIPKIIHYCWFGGNPLPSLAQECIKSWKKYLPDYEIKRWDESNFDVNSIPYTAEAYRQKKYAFVSDYCRFIVLYEYGGIYFDTDVEVIRPMNDIISRGNFMGFELDPDGENCPGKYAPRYCYAVNPGVGFGMVSKHPFIKKMIEHYKDLEFVQPDLSEYNIGLLDIFIPFKKKTTKPYFKTIVAYTTELLCEEGLKNIKGIQNVRDITVYPHEYFAPIDVVTGRLTITNNTYTIHRYMGSWNSKAKPLTIPWVKNLIRSSIPSCIFYSYNKIKRRRYRL